MSEVDDLKERLATAIQILRWELADMWGHVSCRTPRGDSFLLLPLRPPLDHGIPEDDVLEFDMEGKVDLRAGGILPRKFFSTRVCIRRKRMRMP